MLLALFALLLLLLLTALITGTVLPIRVSFIGAPLLVFAMFRVLLVLLGAFLLRRGSSPIIVTVFALFVAVPAVVLAARSITMAPLFAGLAVLALAAALGVRVR